MTTREDNEDYEIPDEIDIVEKLGDEVHQGILNLCALGQYDKAVVENEIQAIIEKSALETSHPIVGLLLFRKYADIANEIIFEKRTRTKISFNRVQFDPSAFILQDINEDKLVGSKALGENAFWLRVVTSVFAFISMVVMASIPDIKSPLFCPLKKFVSSACYNYGTSGCFRNQGTFMFLIVAASVLFIHNMLLVGYYLLPTNEFKRKVLPGVCIMSSHSPTFITPLVDFLFLVMAFLSGILSSLTLARVQHVNLTKNGYIVDGYYTIASLYADFSRTTPKCLNASDDPSPRMSASITMMFFTAILMALCFATSFNHFLKKRTTLGNEPRASNNAYNKVDDEALLGESADV